MRRIRFFITLAESQSVSKFINVEDSASSEDISNEFKKWKEKISESGWEEMYEVKSPYRSEGWTEDSTSGEDS